MKTSEKDIIMRGLSDASEELLRSETIKKGYIKELARIFVKDAGKELGEFFSADGISSELPFELKDELRLLGDGADAGIFSLFVTDLYENRFGAVEDELIFSEASSEGSTVSFVSGSGADSAFDRFSRKFRLSAVHTNRISYSCDAVLDGDADFCIIPVMSANDGRLRSFYKMIDMYGLKIAAAVSAFTSESTMRYALCKRDSKPIFSAPSRIEVSLPSTGDEALSLVKAAEALGSSLLEISSLPSERNGEVFSFTFRLGGSFKPFLLYLNLFYPSFNLIGIYDII